MSEGKIKGISATVLAPIRSCSPGLAKQLVALGIVGEKACKDIDQLPGNKKAIAALAAGGMCDEQEALEKLAKGIGLKLVGFQELKAAAQICEEDFPSMISRQCALKHRCFPLSREKEETTVAFADPLDMESIQAMEFLVNTPVTALLAAEGDIIAAISEIFPEANATAPDLETLTTSDITDETVDLANDAHMESASQAAPIVRLVNKILADAKLVETSDIHFEPGETHLEVRFRVDGIMHSHLKVPKRLQPYVIARLKLLSGMDITEKRRPQDGRFRIRSGGAWAQDIRSSAVPTPQGEKLVLRYLRSDYEGINFSVLGMDDALRKQFEDALSATERLVIVTGPTGSGKTTTLYAAINHLRQGATNIVTVEDPIEFKMPGVTQIQVNPKVGMTFASGLRSILRQDPDVILVGEIRDLETAEIAFQSAQTGHFVLSTLHTNDAPSAVLRLVDLGLERFVISASLGGVLAQRLVRKLCSKCAQPDPNAKATASEYGIEGNKLMSAVGCAACEQTGYKGRVAVYSFLPVTEEVKKLVHDGAGETEISEAAHRAGMRDLFDVALDFVQQGETSVDEVVRVLGQLRRVEELKETSAPKTEILEQPKKTTQAAEGTKSVAELAKKFSVEELEEGERIQVLLIDDDPGVRAVMCRSLSNAGFIVTEAEDGLSALEKVAQFKPDAIVCDLVMPGMDGKEFVEKAREKADTADIPILMLTGSDTEANEIALIEAGANDFVSKASSPAVVITRIRRMLKL